MRRSAELITLMALLRAPSFALTRRVAWFRFLFRCPLIYLLPITFLPFIISSPFCISLPAFFRLEFHLQTISSALPPVPPSRPFVAHRHACSPSTATSSSMTVSSYIIIDDIIDIRSPAAFRPSLIILRFLHFRLFRRRTPFGSFAGSILPFCPAEHVAHFFAPCKAIRQLSSFAIDISSFRHFIDHHFHQPFTVATRCPVSSFHFFALRCLIFCHVIFPLFSAILACPAFFRLHAPSSARLCWFRLPR